MTWPWSSRIGSWVRRLPTKSSLAVKNQPPAYASNVHLPTGCTSPSSGLNAHRFVPMLISFVGSY